MVSVVCDEVRPRGEVLRGGAPEDFQRWLEAMMAWRLPDSYGRGLDDDLTGPGRRFGPVGGGRLSRGRDHDGTHPDHLLVALPRVFPVPGERA